MTQTATPDTVPHPTSHVKHDFKQVGHVFKGNTVLTPAVIPAIASIVIGSVVALLGLLLIGGSVLGFIGLSDRVETEMGAQFVLALSGVLGLALLITGIRVRRAGTARLKPPR
jgi:Na+-transporting methylmalonyl-CoA/oxaloacetate decarboxylase beta subunit